MQSSFREPVNGFLHFGALLTSVLGTGFLMGLAARDPIKLVTFGVYGLCMSLAFLASTAHHLVRSSRRWESWLLKLDHAAIFLFIAGTYTPVTIHLLPAPARWQVLGAVWLMAIAGIAYKLIFFQTPDDITVPPDRLSTTIYVLMGWTIVTQLSTLLQVVSGNGLILALLGGTFYTLGGIILTTKSFDFWPGRLGHHEIWHLCVIGGAVCMYLLIYWHILPAGIHTAHLSPGAV